MDPFERCKRQHPSQRWMDEQVFNSIVDDFYQDEDDGGDDGEPDKAA